MKTVIFDVGNVLVGYDWKSYLRTFNYSEEIYERVADAVFRNKDWEEGDIGRISAEEWLNLFIENAPDLKPQICEVFAGFEGTIVPLSYTEEWLSYFRNLGYKLYYLSNYSRELYERSRDKLRFLDTFDGGIFPTRSDVSNPMKRFTGFFLSVILLTQAMPHSTMIVLKMWRLP